MLEADKHSGEIFVDEKDESAGERRLDHARHVALVHASQALFAQCHAEAVEQPGELFNLNRKAENILKHFRNAKKLEIYLSIKKLVISKKHECNIKITKKMKARFDELLG